MNTRKLVRYFSVLAIVLVLACNLPFFTNDQASGPAAPSIPEAAGTQEPQSTGAGTEAVASSTPSITHVSTPAADIGTGKLTYDVVSEDTAPERRAPYGDSYDINRLERPFLKDMTYVPDLDIYTYSVSSDSTWWYVSIVLIGGDPNNQLGINFGVELDLDLDGFGDYLVIAHPPYAGSWETAPVQVFRDNNHDTGGLSAEKSDAPLTTDGYETLIFNGGAGDTDPDMAWVRAIGGSQAVVSFAFKKSWSGTVFLLGVFADASLKDPTKLDYVDRFTAADAGSPVRDNRYYPLGALYAVDNVCRSAFGFKVTGFEPQLCPSTEPPATRKPRTPQPPTVPPPPVIL